MHVTFLKCPLSVAEFIDQEEEISIAKTYGGP